MKTPQARPFTPPVINLLVAFAAAILLLAGAAPARAQDNKAPEQGFLPSRSYAISDLETISLEGGNLMMRLPLGSLPAGRGGMGHGLRLVYNSKIWKTSSQPVPVPQPQCLPGMICPPPEPETHDHHDVLHANPEAGWRYGFQYKLMLVEREYTAFGSQDPDTYNVCQDWPAVYYYQLKVSFPDGSLHTFRLQGQTEMDGYFGYKPDGSTQWSQCATPAPQTGTMTYYTIDGTYLRLDVQHDADTNWQNNPWTIYFPDGGRVTGGNSPQRIYDRNNNYVEVQSVTNYNGTGHTATRLVDQLGRSVDLEYNTAPGQDTVRTKGFGGEDVALTVKWKTVTVYKSYHTGYATMPLSKSLRVLDQVVLPAQSGGLAYTFGYNAGTANPSAGWGEVSSVTLPSGATAAYQYDRDGESGIYSGFVVQNSPTRKDLTYLREYDGTSTPVTETWLYAIDEFTGQVTAPNGGVSREHFGFLNPGDKLPIKSERPDGSVVERLWSYNIPKDTPNSEAGAVNNYVGTEYTSIKNAAGALSKTAIKTYKYDKNGNLTELKEYDWIDYSAVHDAGGNPTWSVTGATLKRTTLNAYHSPTPNASDSTTDDPDSYHKPTSPRLRSAVASTEVRAGATTVVTRAEFTYDSATTTGNLTKQTSWDSTEGAYSSPLTAANSISVTHQYDIYGNRTLMTDPRGYQAKQVYGAVGGYTGLYPTESYSAFGTTVQRKATQVYDFNTGLVTGVTDVDNNVSSSIDYDVFGRTTLAVAGVGKPEETRTATEYSDAARRIIVRQDLATAGDTKLVSVRHYDQLGRIRLSRRLEDSATESPADEADGIKVQTRYSVSGSNSYQLVSNPYRAAISATANTETTMGWARTKTDNSGRVLEVRSYSGSGQPAPWGVNTTTTGAVTTAYDGVSMTVTDQAGKARRSTADALGNLLQVVEDPGGLGYVTDYVYDALGNLKTVTQAGLQNNVQVTQTRTFTYDSLSRLASAVNPEGGTVQFKYDANGNLVLKIDPRTGGTSLPNCSIPYSGTNIAICNEYDALNRATLRDYGDTTPDVRYYYDAQALPAGAPSFVRGSSEGRLVALTYGGVASTEGSYYGYDALGRALRRVQRTDSANYLSEATYNKAGATLTETYPAVPGATDRRTVSYSYDGAGRLSSLAGGATTYAPGATVGLSAVSYAPHGALDKETLGNGLVHDINYNNRLQPTQIRLGTSAAPTSVLNLAYNYGATANNGNVLDVTEKIGAWTAKQVYTYDAVNRLDTTTETNGSTTTYWTEDNDYDRFGNRWEDNAGVPSLTFTSKNRIAGFVYDLTGNVKNDTVHTYDYDADNRVKTVNGEPNVYVYDGEGKRVKKNFSLGEQTRFIYGIGGRVVAEFDATSGAWKKEYIYGSGGVVATIEPTIGSKYTTADHLGSPRVVTSNTGTPVSRHDYRPFGQELGEGDSGRTGAQLFGVNDGLRQKFGQKERDAETGLDYFLARYYSSGQGRFTSPDPIIISDKQTLNPQLWNLYNYAGNNPLAYADPTGMELVKLGQHTDEVIKKRQKEIEEELKNKNLTKEQKNSLKAEKKTLDLEKQGNKIVGQYLAALDTIGERGGLQLSDFTLTTDPVGDFASNPDFVKAFGGDVNKARENAEGNATAGMFVWLGFSTQIYVNAASPDYKGSRGEIPGVDAADYIIYGASATRHEQTHFGRDNSEHTAYSVQLQVLQKFGPSAFKSKDFYDHAVDFVKKGSQRKD